MLYAMDATIRGFDRFRKATVQKDQRNIIQPKKKTLFLALLSLKLPAELEVRENAPHSQTRRHPQKPLQHPRKKDSIYSNFSTILNS